MTYPEYKKMVTEDIPPLDLAALDYESSRTAQLHNKYFLFLQDEKRILKYLKRNLAKVIAERKAFLNGTLEPNAYKKNVDIAEIAFRDLKPLKTKAQIDEWLENDPDVQAAEDAYADQEEIVEYLEKTINASISSRSFHIAAAQKALDFKNGRI